MRVYRLCVSVVNIHEFEQFGSLQCIIVSYKLFTIINSILKSYLAQLLKILKEVQYGN